MEDAINISTLPIGQPKSSDGLPYPNALMNPPGMVGELAQAIGKICNREQEPQVLIAAALVVIAIASGNRFRIGNKRTALSLYMLLVQPTGAGKGDINKAIFSALRYSVEVDIITDMPASGVAILRALGERAKEDKAPNMAALIDEVGRQLQIKQGDVHSEKVLTEILKLFGMGNAVMPGRKYANTTNNIESIWGPFINLLGSTTSIELMKALSSSAISNGMLNRMLLIEGSDKIARMKPDKEVSPEIPEDLARRVARIGKNRTHLEYCEMFFNEEDGDTKLARTIYRMNTDDAQNSNLGGYGEMWARAVQYADVIAGILQLGLETTIPKKPIEISLPNYEWAMGFVNWSFSRWCERLEADLSDDKFEANFKKVKKYISGFGDKGVARTELTRKFRDLSMINPVLLSLHDGGVLHIVEKGAGVKTVQWYSIKEP